MLLLLLMMMMVRILCAPPQIQTTKNNQAIRLTRCDKAKFNGDYTHPRKKNQNRKKITKTKESKAKQTNECSLKASDLVGFK